MGHVSCHCLMPVRMSPLVSDRSSDHSNDQLPIHSNPDAYPSVRIIHSFDQGELICQRSGFCGLSSIDVHFLTSFCPFAATRTPMRVPLE